MKQWERQIYKYVYNYYKQKNEESFFKDAVIVYVNSIKRETKDKNKIIEAYQHFIQNENDKKTLG